MIESLACGTPVIAWRNGSVPEVIDDQVTGFVVDSIEEAVESVHRVQWLDRAICRQTFERRFDAVRMAQDHVEVYRRLIHNAAEPAHRKPSVLGSLPRDSNLPLGHRSPRRNVY